MRLGPEAIGSTVEVRWQLFREGRPGELAVADVRGVLEAWDTEVRVRRDDGRLEVFPTGRVLSGRLVTSRADTRPQVSTVDAERRTARLWTGVTVERLGDWELRHLPRAPRRKRANSALAIGDPVLTLTAAASLVREHYARLGLAALVQVEVGSGQERFFLDAGWQRVEGDAHFLLGSVSRARRLAGPAADVSVTGDIRVETDEGVVEGTVDGDWLGIHGLVVQEDARRRGVARGLVAVLLEAAAERGATSVWLHVETGNEAAIRLYEGLGLAIHHTMRYLRSP